MDTALAVAPTGKVDAGEPVRVPSANERSLTPQPSLPSRAVAVTFGGSLNRLPVGRFVW